MEKINPIQLTVFVAAGIATIIMAFIVPEQQKEQKRKELEDMRVLNISVEISDEQYLALKRRAARTGKSQESWTVDDEINYTAAAALSIQAEEEMQRERVALRNARITDDYITDDTPIRVVAVQKEEPQTLSDDPEGEPDADAGSNHHGQETVNDAVVTTNSDHDLFLRCIQAEAGNQPLEGKQAAAEVILNRVFDTRFPNTITEVIMQTGQFTVVSNGTINSAVPDETTIAAVEAAMAGSRVLPPDYVFFNNAPIGRDVIRIADHYFGR